MLHHSLHLFQWCLWSRQSIDQLVKDKIVFQICRHFMSLPAQVLLIEQAPVKQSPSLAHPSFTAHFFRGAHAPPQSTSVSLVSLKSSEHSSAICRWKSRLDILSFISLVYLHKFRICHKRLLHNLHQCHILRLEDISSKVHMFHHNRYQSHHYLCYHRSIDQLILYKPFKRIYYYLSQLLTCAGIVNRTSTSYTISIIGTSTIQQTFSQSSAYSTTVNVCFISIFEAIHTLIN